MRKGIALFRKIKLIITMVIIVGVVMHLILVYTAANSLKIKDGRIVGIYPRYPKPDEYEVKFMLTIYNPKTTDIEIDYISYDVYIENEFIGSGEKPRFVIGHGIHNYTFIFSFSLSNLSSASSSLLLSGGEVNVDIKGDVIIPAKFLGLFTWRYIKLPYEIEEKVKIAGGSP